MRCNAECARRESCSTQHGPYRGRVHVGDHLGAAGAAPEDEAQPAVDDTLRTFMGAIPPEAFTALGNEEVRLSRIVSDASQAIDNVTKKFPYTAAELKENLSALSPMVEGMGNDVIGEYTDARVAALSASEAALVEAETRYTTFTERFENAGTALPNPHKYEPKELVEGEPVPIRGVESTGQGDKAIQSQLEALAETTTPENTADKKQPEKRNRSEDLAALLLKSAGTLISAKAIARELYGKDTQAAINRVSSLVWSNTTGAVTVLGQSLKENNHQLFRSRPEATDTNGKVTKLGYTYAVINSETSDSGSLPDQTVDGDRTIRHEWSVVEFEEKTREPALDTDTTPKKEKPPRQTNALSGIDFLLTYEGEACAWLEVDRAISSTDPANRKSRSFSGVINAKTRAMYEAVNTRDAVVLVGKLKPQDLPYRGIGKRGWRPGNVYVAVRQSTYESPDFALPKEGKVTHEGKSLDANYTDWKLVTFDEESKLPRLVPVPPKQDVQPAESQKLEKPLPIPETGISLRKPEYTAPADTKAPSRSARNAFVVTSANKPNRGRGGRRQNLRDLATEINTRNRGGETGTVN